MVELEDFIADKESMDEEEAGNCGEGQKYIGWGLQKKELGYKGNKRPKSYIRKRSKAPARKVRTIMGENFYSSRTSSTISERVLDKIDILILVIVSF